MRVSECVCALVFMLEGVGMRSPACVLSAVGPRLVCTDDWGTSQQLVLGWHDVRTWLCSNAPPPFLVDTARVGPQALAKTRWLLPWSTAVYVTWMRP